jgi:hypothetical protein
MPVAMVTGLFTWWLNYLAKPMKPVRIKITLSCVVLFLSIIIFFWRIADPIITQTSSISRIVYLAVTFALVPMISVIGWLGASLTFPLEKK